MSGVRGGTPVRGWVRHVLPAVLGLAAVLVSTAVASERALAPLSPDDLAAVSCGRQAGDPVPPGC